MEKGHPNYEIIQKIGKLKPLPKVPLVSVIIPCYNEEKYVWKAIESLLKQSYPKIEIIVADNASTDNSVKVIQKYGKQGVKLVKNDKNEGFGGGCNAGWKVAKGELLMFFDADEIYGVNYIQTITKPILEGKDVCTMHNLEKVANKDKLWARAVGKRHTTLDGRGQIFTIIRRDVFEKLGPFDPSLGYADDKTLFYKHGLTSTGLDTDIWHHNPDSLISQWNHGKWVGKSYKYPKLTVLSLPVFPGYVLYKALKDFKKDPYWKFVFFLPWFHTVKYFAYLVGAIEKLKGEAPTEKN